MILEKWQYVTSMISKHDSFPGANDDARIEAHMNSKGQEGWELVSVADRRHEENGYLWLYFKRPIAAVKEEKKHTFGQADPLAGGWGNSILSPRKKKRESTEDDDD